MTSTPSSELRDRIAAALATPMGSYTWETKADAVLAVVQPELDRLRAELEQARQQTEDAHCRLHHIQARVEQITDEDLAVGIGLDLMPWLDGPLHPDHLADYRATQPSA